MTYINGIPIDVATEALPPLEFEVTNESINSAEMPNIATHVKKLVSSFTLTCAMNADNRDQLYQQLKDLAESRQVVTLIQSTTINNLVITKLVETGYYMNTICFEITLQKVVIGNIKRVAKPVKKVSKIVKSKKVKGKITTSVVPKPDASKSILWLKKK